MDEAVDPCEDFFEFACGGFLKKTIIPDDKTTISRFNEISDELQLKLRGLVEAEDSPNEPRFSKMVKNLYKSCMDTGESGRGVDRDDTLINKCENKMIDRLV